MTAVCPVCDAHDLIPFLHREGVPVHQNLLVPGREAARAVPRGDVDLRSCARCGFVGNTAFRAELLAYGRGYENSQTASPSFDRHVDELVAKLVDEGIRARRVVEVGCGNGYFLKRLCERGDNIGTGFDPSYAGPETDLGGQVRFVRAFYSRAQASAPADVVVCRHVIEHVSDPAGLLRDVRGALGASPEAVVYFETPALEWILEGTVIWDFFYEHCGYFTESALRNTFRVAGLEPLETRRVFGGQYLWIKARPVPEPSAPEAPAAAHAEALARYRSQEARTIGRWRRTVARLASRGTVGVWGAGAKGVTFVNLLDPDTSQVRCLIDINPAKSGHFTPGTAHPIVLPSALSSLSVTDAILMNPNYLEETRGMIRDLGLELRLHVAA